MTHQFFVNASVAAILLATSAYAQPAGLVEQLRVANQRLSATQTPALSDIQARATAMRELARSNPAQALALMLGAQERQRILELTPTAERWVESEGEWRGRLSVAVADDFENHRSETRTYLVATGEWLRLHTLTAPAEPVCDSEVKVSGFRLGSEIIAATLAPVGEPRDSPVCSSTGVQKTVVILAALPSMAIPPLLTQPFVQSAFSSSYRNVDSLYREASYNKTSFNTTVVGPVTLDADYDCADPTGLVQAAIRAADSSVNYQDFNRLVVIAPRKSSCSVGLGSLGCTSLASGDGSFTASYTYLASDYLTSGDAMVSVAAHELGHNLGLGHSNSRDYGNVALGPIGAPATDTEYGDIYAMMGMSFNSGGQFVLGHFAPQHKVQLGWMIAGSDYQTVETAGIFTLSPYSLAPPGLKAIRVRRGTGINEWLWIESRKLNGPYDSTLTLYSPTADKGVLVRHERPGDPAGKTHLLHYYPSAIPNDFRNAPLVPGPRWDDPSTNLSLQAVSSGSGLQVAVTYRAGGCTYVLTPASLAAPTAGGSYSFDVMTGAACTWQASASQAFVLLGVNSSGMGNGKVSFSVAANPTLTTRTAAIDVNGQLLQISQAPADFVATLSPTSAVTVGTGGAGTVNVTLSGTASSWSAVSQDPWIQPAQVIASFPSGSVQWLAAPNTGPSPRTGTIIIAGMPFVVTQAGVASVTDTIGRVTTLAGLDPVGVTGAAADVRFRNPSGLLVDAAGNILVADSASNRILKVSPGGMVTSVAGIGLPASTGDGGPATQAGISSPKSPVFDAQGSLAFIDDSGLRKITANGNITLTNTLQGVGAVRLARGPDGSIYATGWNHKVMRLTPAGDLVTFAGTGIAGSTGDGGPALSAQLNYPQGLAVDAQGRVYVSETNGNRVRRIDLNGVISTVAGTGVGGFSGDGGPAAQAQVHYPIDLTFDPVGNLIIVDTNNMRIRRVANGIITTLIGGT